MPDRSFDPDLAAEIERAAARIAPYARRTPCDRSPLYSERSRAEIFLKLENFQQTGSFKVRGALNKVLSLDETVRARGLVTASTGNHGAAVAWACREVGASALVFAPESGDPGKLAAIERLGADLRRVPGDPLEAERAARREAESTGRAYVSPYNDRAVVAGQGTIGREIVEQVGDLDALVCSVGGGGLISGIATALRAAGSSARVFGLSPSNSAVLLRSVEAGEILDLPSKPTLSDGTAGGLEPGSVTFELARSLVDEWMSVDEPAIAAALRRHVFDEHQLIEGAAAVALAGLDRIVTEREDLVGRRVAIVLCGANIGSAVLIDVLSRR